MKLFQDKDILFVAIDIGGTWIKGCASVMEAENRASPSVIVDNLRSNTARVKSSLSPEATVQDLVDSIGCLLDELGIQNKQVAGIGISAAGIVDYAGSKILKASAYLAALKNDTWIRELEAQFKCPVAIINDADAASIGISELGLLMGNKTVGIMSIGTGLGFTVWKNGRRWRPGKVFTLLGSISTPAGSFNSIASASALASADRENNLTEVLTNVMYADRKRTYLKNLAEIINTAAIIYNLDEVMICGGLADAVSACDYPLENELRTMLADTPVELNRSVTATVLKEGNVLQLMGALALAKGESVARANQVFRSYKSIKTEIPYQRNIQLQNLPTSELIELFWKAEQESGELMKNSIPVLTQVIDEISRRIESGGRLIYVGAGTSGRIAAMDAVEIPCTYGFPEDKIMCIVSGGLAEASIEIESDSEEDASAVPEMLLMNIQSNDVVIGISASGTAYYVQSALAFAKNRGAYAVMIQSDSSDLKLPFCDMIVPLNSGNEVVAGSTRMKAGTATKKILNFLSSSVMIKMGKVDGAYMIDMACINNKLIARAQDILGILYNMNEQEALQELQEADMQLSKVIQKFKIKL